MKIKELQQLSIFLLGISIWLFVREYTGIRHDALLYTVEALFINDPTSFQKDLFLAYGSQGKFTFFPLIYAKLISIVGLQTAAISITIIGKMLWLYALAVASHSLCKRALWGISVFTVLIFSAFYDSHHIFSYGESFATPRIYAEAFSILAFAQIYKEKFKTGAVLLIAAFAFHPLMALPAFALIISYLFFLKENTRKLLVLFLLSSTCTAIILGLSNVAPFNGLLNQYDDEWLNAILLRNLNIFPSNWDNQFWNKYAIITVILVVGWWHNINNKKHVFLALLAVIIVTFGITYIGTELWRNILITQLQLWRSLWLVQILTLLMTPTILQALWYSSIETRLQASLILTALLANNSSSGLLGVSLIVLLFISNRPLFQTYKDDYHRYLSSLAYLLPATILIIAVAHNFSIAHSLNFKQLISDAAIITLLVILPYKIVKTTLSAYVVLCFSLLLCILSLYHWDQRTIKLTPKHTIELQNIIPKGSVVLSVQNVEQAWLLLGRAHYASQMQTAGALFSKKTATEGIRRLKRMKQANFPDSELEWGKHILTPSTEIDDNTIRFLCEDPILDYVITSSNTKNPFKIFDCKRGDR